MNILINLPPTFFSQPELLASWQRLTKFGEIRQTSHNTADEIADDLAWADSILMWSWPVLDEALLQRAGRLDYAGHIDISQQGAKSELGRGLAVSVSRSGFSPAVAEMALGLILNGLRRISDYHAAMRSSSEQWVNNFPSDINPLERQLTGLNVGIVGFGRVGRRLAQLLKGFDVHLKIVDPFVSEEVVSSCGGQKCSVDEMIAQADVVVLCAASNTGTDKLFNAQRIASLQPNSLFINVARASLVDQAALLARAQQGDVIMSLDVFEKEPLDQDSIWRTLPNVYLTPHRAGGIIASVQRNVDWLIDDLQNHLEGQPRKYPLTESMISSLDL